MKYLDYIEKRSHGNPDFPFAYYDVTEAHPRYEMMYHWHTESEIMRILSGSFDITINGVAYELKEGDLLFINGGIPHHAHYECLVFDIDHLLQKTPECAAWIHSLSIHEKAIRTRIPQEAKDIHKICALLFKMMKDKPKGYAFYVMGFFNCLMGALIQHAYIDDNSTLSIHHQEKLQQIRNVLSYMDAHYQEAVTLQDLADAAGMNSRYFCSFFKKSTQKTPMEYLHSYRVEQACSKLAANRQSITEIALDCGFSDSSYFTKVFRKYKGMTPREYQQSLA